MQRPDLTSVDPDVLRYIEFLEKKLGVNNPSRPRSVDTHVEPERGEPLPPEPETTATVITISASGLLKATYRHLYNRQHRGGMGVFDLDTSPGDPPALLSHIEENQTLLLFTNRARVFRVNLNQMERSPVRSKGSSQFERLGLEPGERITALIPEQARGYVAMTTELGRVRCLRHHLFGEHMRPGTSFFPPEAGDLVSACWTAGDGDLLVLTRSGMGIRFPEKAISPQGDQAIRLTGEDRVAALTPVYEDSDVFMVGFDGKGTLRTMSGFAANKSSGGSGKIAFKNNRVIGAATVKPDDDLFMITRQSKIIRFHADEVPVTDGVVQGVNCMALRADEIVAMLHVPADRFGF